MDIILWRHAEAENKSPDAGRRLTKKGREQADRMGRWLRSRVPAYRLISSPAARARETAEGLDPTLEIMPELYSSASPIDVLEESGWPTDQGTVILVGHQPLLGEIAAYLMIRRAEPWDVKKGAAWWFRSTQIGMGAQAELIACIPPKLA